MRSPNDEFWTTIVVIGVLLAVYDNIATWWYNRGKKRVSNKPPIIGVPLKTQLRAIVRRDGLWQIWTGIDDMQKPYTAWTGTLIECHDNGSAHMIVIQPNGEEDIYRVM